MSHPNTIKLIQIEHEAIKLGWYEKSGNTCFCEEVARRSGEMGNEYPSDKAINIAKRMLANLKRKRLKS